jgi:hypothetical protein
MNDHHHQQYYLFISMLNLSELASILESDPNALAVSSSGHSTRKSSRTRESKRLAGLIKKSYADSQVLMREVYPLTINLKGQPYSGIFRVRVVRELVVFSLNKR